MSWMNAENPIYLRNDFENKDNMSENGAKFDTDKKRWYIPPGQNPINFRGKGCFRQNYVPEKEFDVLDFWSVLNVPFEKREKVKKLGAKFDRALKKWYIPKNSPTGKFIDFDSFYEFWPKDLKKFIFNNKYAAQEILEESGQSIVFGAYDMETYQRVAIKLFYETSHNNKFLEAFNRESLYLQNHLKDIPNIMSVIDHGYHRAAESNFLVFDYIPISLHDIIDLDREDQIDFILKEFSYGLDDLNDEDIAQERAEILEALMEDELNKSPWEQILEDISSIVCGLCEAYKVGIIHRDIKPSNIFINYDEETEKCIYILGDFGSAKMNDIDLKTKKLTTVNWSTPVWGPPSLKKEDKYPDTRDVYSCAAIIVSFLTKKIPESDESLRKLLKGSFKKLVDKSIYEVIRNSLNTNPAKRPKNILEFRELLNL